MITIFELNGSDVIEFLNNQVVTELKNKSDTTDYTVICNPKGRILFSIFYRITPECTFIAVDTKLCDNFLQFINMRVFRMDVTIQKSNAQLISWLENEMYNVHIDTNKDGKKNAVKVGWFWQTMFQQGIPWITKESSELFIPQHLNLDQTKIIDFDKGCYPGQEVIARLHFLGKIKKRMQQVSYHNETAHNVGEIIVLDDNTTQAEICSASIFNNGKWKAQGIIRLK